MPKIPKKIKTVIIADDHAIVRDGLRLILEARDDITVVADVADGREAVQRAIELRPDVVVMDISMPGLNGIEATRQIREQRKNTQVVILSMHATSEHIYQALHAGAIAYLLKDSVGREVGEAVLAAARGERYLSTPLFGDLGRGSRGDNHSDQQRADGQYPAPAIRFAHNNILPVKTYGNDF